MEETTLELVKQWLIKANNDLQVIENELNSAEPVMDAICLHAQQAAEKFLKTFLVAHNIDYPQTHNISAILNLCRSKDEQFIDLKQSITLSKYATDFRYPADFYIPDLEEAKEAYQLSLKVKDFVLEKLKLLQ